MTLAQVMSRGVLAAAFVVILVGCYTLQPAPEGVLPPAGAEMAFDINDAGRVALGGAMGPAIARIEGRLVNRDSSAYIVAVREITLLNGGDQTWSGERVQLKIEYVTEHYERRLSRGRSIAMGAAGIGLIALIASRSILTGGNPDDGRPPPDTAQTNRMPLLRFSPLRIPALRVPLLRIPLP